jgi:multidrug transporter EmrE-like cation transporter
MDFSTINHLAVFAATISAFVLGGIWYGPLFGKAWMKENGFSEETLKGANQGKIYGLAFLWTLIMAYNLAMFLNDPSVTMEQAVMYSFFTGFGWIAMAIFVIGLFERKSMKLMVINGGYMTVALVVMGVILGAWR